MSLNVPPGPDGLPVVGNLFPYLDSRLDFLERCAEYGDVVHRSVLGNGAYVLTHPDHVERVLLREDERFRKQELTRMSIDQTCGNPVISPDEHPWEERFVALSPAFKRDVIDSVIGDIAGQTDRMVDELASGGPFDLLEEMEYLVDEIIVMVLFGDQGVDDIERLSEAYQHVTNRLITGRRVVPLWAPTPGNLKVKRSAEYLIATIREMVEDVRAADGSDNDSLLSVILANDDGDLELSTEYLKNELSLLIGAAHETTALALTFTWYLVANRPDVQRRLQAEVDEVLGDELPGRDDLQELTFTEKVIKEALRLYPPVFITTRTPKETVTFDGYTIPEGARIILPQWVVHRDERWYDDPEAFRPDRWTREFERARPDFAYFPFSGGPKQCIGRTLAMTELQVVLATMVRRLDVEQVTDRPLELETALSLKPTTELEMVARPRSRQPSGPALSPVE